MALRRTDENVNESLSGMKAKQVFSNKEKKVLTTFSIEPSFKAELEELFSDMGLGWAAGVRFALREFLILNHHVGGVNLLAVAVCVAAGLDPSGHRDLGSLVQVFLSEFRAAPEGHAGDEIGALVVSVAAVS